MLERAARIAWWLVTLLAVVAAVLPALFLANLLLSRPRLDGIRPAPGLVAQVKIERDAAGVPTITGRSRRDVAYATGYLHAQERFFQMDMLRRAASGELGELFGKMALSRDAEARKHLFRKRARAVLAGLSPEERVMLAAYTDGVNRGLADLRARPFEYAVLRRSPQPWRPEDSLLVVYAMYLDLEDSSPELELNRGRAEARGGKALADLLYPVGTELDAPIDFTWTKPPKLPAALVAGELRPDGILRPAEASIPKGSNNWAVAGQLSNTDAAIVANDMHLGLRMPTTWYRARFVLRPGFREAPTLDISGVTLPGVFPMIVGSNRHVAWGFTDSYIDLHDAVIVESVSGRPGWYRTPDGPRPVQIVRERLCARDDCRLFQVRETIWGPITARLPDGRPVADRWIAHDAQAIRLEPMLALEKARDVREALAAAHRAALPDENFIVGDSAGHIAWSIIGRVPRRFGMSGRDAESWANGRRGWAGYLAPGEVPTVVDPPSGRLWTANNRVVGGAALAKLGDAGYDDGARAREIAGRLFARQRFTTRDMLAIQLDTTALRIPFWQDQMLAAIRRRSEPKLEAMIPFIRSWDGKASEQSVGYRLLRSFRDVCVSNAYDAYLGRSGDATKPSYGAHNAEEALRLLLRARPAGLVPPGYGTWDAFVDRSLDQVARSVYKEAGGRLARFTWGAWMHEDIHHPLAKAVPLLGLLTDPPDLPMPGDGGVPRAQYRGGGASERLDVSPGHEAQGILHMPGGQAGNPLSPYYLAGHEDWVRGRASPLLPGRTRWRLVLKTRAPAR